MVTVYWAPYCLPQVPLFQNTEIGFTKLLALSIKPVLFLKNEYIVRKGDIGSEVGIRGWTSSFAHLHLDLY